jgi:hypothetical protein
MVRKINTFPIYNKDGQGVKVELIRLLCSVIFVLVFSQVWIDQTSEFWVFNASWP